MLNLFGLWNSDLTEMSAPAVFRRRRYTPFSRLAWAGLFTPYHVGVYEYPLLRNYDSGAAVQFPSVELAADTRVMFPGPNEALTHWCGANSWDFEVTFTPTAGLTSNYPSLSGWTKSVNIKTGRTATLNSGATSFTHDSTTPKTRDECHTAQAITRFVWGWEGSQAIDDYIYSREANLIIEIEHGHWGYHGDNGTWLLHLGIKANEIASRDLPEDSYDDIVYWDSGTSSFPPHPYCNAAYDVVYPETEIPEVSVSWTCWRRPAFFTSMGLLETDPDAETDGGTFFGRTVRLRETPSGETYLPGESVPIAPSIEVTITPSTYYS